MHYTFRISLITFIVILTVCPPVVNAQDIPLPVLRTKSLFTIQFGFSQPSDVTVGNEGKIYVLDGVNNRVKVFNQQGTHLFSFGGTGKGDGKFDFPLGIATDNSGRIYVADSGNHRVQIFSHQGNYLSQLSTDANKRRIKPSDPTDVAVNSTLKRCYVVDNDNHCLLIYDLEKNLLLSTHGTMGMDKREFRFPFLLDINKEGNIHIVEVINTRVKVLDPEGNYLSTIGSWGVEKGEFYRPKGVAIDAKNRVFVSDSYLGIIQVFDKEGYFLYVLGDGKGEIMKFETPTGLFIDKNMRLYVVEMLANQVRVLRLRD